MTIVFTDPALAEGLTWLIGGSVYILGKVISDLILWHINP